MLIRGALILSLVAALAPAGCGGRSETDRVSETVRLFADSTAQHDYTTLCQKVLAPELIAKLKPFNLSCEIAVRHYFGDVRSPRVEIRRVRLLGRDQALAAVQSTAAGQAPAAAELRLVKTAAGWRIARLGSDAGAAPRVAPPPGSGSPSPTTPND